MGNLQDSKHNRTAMPILHIDPFSAVAFDTAIDKSVLFNNSTEDELRSSKNKKRRTFWKPTSVHLQKTDEAYLIFIDVPGVKQEDMQMQLTDKNETLLLSGVRKFLSTSEEVDEAKFEKHFRIGHDVDVEMITADLSNGVLKITAPKKEAPSPVTIPIKVGN